MMLYISGTTFGQADVHTLSDVSKISSAKGVVVLAEQRRAAKLPGRPITYYSTEDDIFVRTRIFSPGALRSFDYVEAIGSTPRDENQNQVTSFAFRVHDGADAYYWDGASWVVAGAGNWNSLADFNANLASVDIAALAFEIRLMTTDDRFTPVLRELCFRWTGRRVDIYREWLYSTVVRSLKDNIRPVKSITLPGNGGVLYNLSDGFDDKTDVTEVVAAFDLTADPSQSVDIFDSYDLGTGVMTLTTAVPATNDIWVDARYKPDVAVTTSSDYVEDANVPALWITNVTPQKQSTILGLKPVVVDRSVSPPQATAYVRPIRLQDLDLEIAAVASSALDLTRLKDALIGWMDLHSTLRSPNLDIEIQTREGSVFGWETGNTDISDTRMAVSSFSLLQVPILYDAAAANATGDGSSSGPVEDLPAVEQVVTTWLTDDGGNETIIPSDC
jgi:hypothetical protein